MKPAIRYTQETQCTSKRSYKHRRDAKRVLRRQQTHGHPNLTVYRCPWCNMHHIGTNRDH